MLRSCTVQKQICSPFKSSLRCWTRGRHTAATTTPVQDAVITAKPAAKPALLTLDYGKLNHYTQTSAPTSEQVTAANRFFTTHKPSYLFTAAHFRDFPHESNVPEVTFLGRSNVGKSSLLNTLFNRNKTQTALAHVSKRPGKTKTMNVFGVGQEGTAEGKAGGGVTKTVKPGMSAELHEKRGAERQVRRDEIIRQNWMGRGGIAVVDCPGYGFHSREEWGQEVLKYLQNRKQLRRAFVLVDCEHGLKSTDRDILGLLREASVPHQIILSKADKVLNLGPREPSPVALSRNLLKLREICEGIRNEVQPNNARGPVALGDILCCSSERNWGPTRLGIDGIRFAILQAAGLGEGSGRQALDLSMDNDASDSNLIAWNTM